MLNKKQTALSFLFFVLVWQIFSFYKKEFVFFPSFFEVLKELFSFFREGTFWKLFFFTLFRASLGFICSLFFAIVFSLLAFWEPKFELLWGAFFQICRILPSVVLIILLLVFLPIVWVPFVIQLCVILPLLYEQSFKSLQEMPREYEEFLYFYMVHPWKKFRQIYLPLMLQELHKNLESVLGLCIKITIAGELLAQEENSIGGAIFTEKMYLNISGVLAWCLVLLLLHSILAFCFRKKGEKR